VQNVSAQLAASSGHCGFSSAYTLYHPEVGLERVCKFEKAGKSESLEKQHLDQ
jgi:hypothetical protein